MRLPLWQQLGCLPIPDVGLAVTITTADKRVCNLWKDHISVLHRLCTYCFKTCRGSSFPGWSPDHRHTQPPCAPWIPRQNIYENIIAQNTHLIIWIYQRPHKSEHWLNTFNSMNQILRWPSFASLWSDRQPCRCRFGCPGSGRQWTCLFGYLKMRKIFKSQWLSKWLCRTFSVTGCSYHWERGWHKALNA